MEDTLGLSWIQEEEALIHMNSIPAKQPLSKIEMRFLFVDTDMYVKEIPARVVNLDISGNVSILSNECLMEHITIAKREYIETYASSGIFSIMDVFIWNNELEHAHLYQYIKNGFPNKFTNASISSPIVLKPSLPIFHTTQTIFVVFRECKDNTRKSAKSTGVKQTKRVRFQPHSYNNNTRKMK
jgi:hypothetical protein